MSYCVTENFGSQRAIAEAARHADELMAENQAREELLTEKLRTLIDNGDASALVAGVKWPMRNGVYVPVSLADCLLESLAGASATFAPFAQYLIDQANEGDKRAQGLLDGMVKEWVSCQ